VRASRVLGLGGEVTVPLKSVGPDPCEEGDADPGEIERDVASDEGADSGQIENDRSVSPTTSTHHPLDQVRVLDISEADVARIIPRVLSHRLRVLDGPEDEALASAMFSVVGKKARQWERSTVKDILVQILSEV
jgi:hypothetical protein